MKLSRNKLRNIILQEAQLLAEGYEEEHKEIDEADTYDLNTPSLEEKVDQILKMLGNLMLRLEKSEGGE